MINKIISVVILNTFVDELTILFLPLHIYQNQRRRDSIVWLIAVEFFGSVMFTGIILSWIILVPRLKKDLS